jgi:hypothetical protein
MVHILIEINLSSQTALRMLSFPFWINRCALANCSFAAVVTTLKVSGLRYLEVEVEGQRYNSLKNGLFEANRLAIADCQS